MLEFTAKIKESSIKPITTVTLPLDKRQKSRQRVLLDNGQEAAILLKRGTVLHNNDLLISKENTIVRVQAADEQLSMVQCSNPLLFARACYHLGNRHVPLQIKDGLLLHYLHDHVLDDMLRGFGLTVLSVTEPFEPEPGAYGGTAGHHHAH